jgi:hypothetical protein
MSKVLKFGLTLLTELTPLLGNIVPTWTILVFSELKSGANLLAPEGVIMLPAAFLLDAIGFIIIFVVGDDYGIMDLISTLIIGLWMWTRSGVATAMRAASEEKIANE